MLDVEWGARYNWSMAGGKDGVGVRNVRVANEVVSIKNDGLAELNNFVMKLKTDFMQFRFLDGKRFTFRPPRTIILEPLVDYAGVEEKYRLSVLHEVGHAILEHKNYTTDPDRLRMESEAWKKAKELCLRYGVTYDTDYVEGELDTYREWLHRKSRCPECGLTRYQTRGGLYRCPRCDML